MPKTLTHSLVAILIAMLVSPLVYAERLPPPHPVKPRLNIVTENFPPFQTLKNGTMTGPMLDYVKEACALAVLDCTITMMPWREALEQAETGKADAIFSILLGVKEREDMFYTSQQVVRTAYSFFVASDSTWRWNGDNKILEGMTIGTYGPSGTSLMAQELLEQTDDTRLVVERTNLTVFNNLVAGVYGPQSAVVVNKDVGLYLLSANSIVGPKLAGDLKTAFFGVGYSRKSLKPELRVRFMSALAVLREGGGMSDLLRSTR